MRGAYKLVLRRWQVGLVGLACLASCAPEHGPAETRPTSAAKAAPSTRAALPQYVRAEVMIRMRDGAELHTVVLRPAASDASGPPLPFLVTRTPYGVDGASPGSILFSRPELARSGYIFVFQDIRGRYGSSGQFVMNRPVVPHGSPSDVDETTDTRDTIDWLLKHQKNNNGRVGVVGISYPGFTAMMAGINPHPAVKAISPQAPMTDGWIGDDFFHNGAFRQSYGFDYVQEMEAQKTDGTVDSKEDQFDFFLRHVNFEGAARSAGMQDLPTARAFLDQPEYTKFWRDMAVQPRLKRPEVPVLEVGGHWDQEDMWGPQAEYAALRPGEHKDPAGHGDDPKHKVFMVLGPWNHGGWAGRRGTSLGGNLGTVSFGAQNTSNDYRTTFEVPFFEHYLKDNGNFDLDDTASFRTGENQWHRYDQWPPNDGFRTVKMYLSPGKALNFNHPAAGEPATYVSDPANPVPYRHRPIQSTYGQGSRWRTWLVEDQKFVSARKDLANFSTAPLASPVTVTGDVVAHLFASTSGTDGDWIVKLIDAYPESEGGYQLMVGSEILRGRYRNSFTTPEPVKPNETTEYRWSLHAADHAFLKGHRIMVQVQSTWFPLYDRNPQTWVPNIMRAPADAYGPATITIDPRSHIELPVTTDSTLP